LKIVVYQHVAGMGLETIQSVSTRSDDDHDGDDGRGETEGTLRRTLSHARESAGSLGRSSVSTRSTRSDAPPGRSNGRPSQPENDDPGIYFGELNLDLAEYASEEGRMGKGGVTRRYLLKGGKTNAMIKVRGRVTWEKRGRLLPMTWLISGDSQLTIELCYQSGETNFIT
jgi:hypothetical protein